MNHSAVGKVTYRSCCADYIIDRVVNLDCSVNFTSYQQVNLNVFIAIFTGSISDDVIAIFH
jgi:hypothetical protein